MADVAEEDDTKAVAPKGYGSAGVFLEEARERFQEGVDSDRENRDAALDDLRFIAGEQWDGAVKAARIRKGRPVLTINTLPQYVGQVIGDTRSNRPSIKVRPAEDGDKKVAEVRQGLIRFIENQSSASQVYALAAEDQVSCGIGHFRVGLEYATNDTFDQDIRIRHIPNPFAVVWDPQSVEPTGADARFAFVVDEMDRKTFEATNKKATPSELTIPMADGGWVSRDSVRVTEYWSMKERERTIALLMKPPAAQPQIVDITDSGAEDSQFIVAGRVRKVIQRTACMYLITGTEVLEGPFEYAISRIPIFKVTGREIRIAERRYRFGLIRFAKDSIRMKNLMRSSAMEWVAKAPRAQWLLHASDEAEANRYRNAGRSDDPVLTYSGSVPPQRIDPATAPSALLQEAQFNDQDIKDVTGLHDASLGMKSNETSGKAIMARERQGDVATFMYHDNLNAAIRECGKVVNEFIPVVFDTARTVVVLGEDESSSPTRINDPMDPESIDLKVGRYDIVVETGPSYSTKRVEAAESMMQFVQSVPAAAQAAGDLIAEAMDWPGAEAIAKRLKKTLPPGIAEDDGEEMSPEQQQARQQAMQQAQIKDQMQQRAGQLDLAEREAKVGKLRAEANEIDARARGAAQPQGQQDHPLDLQLKEQQVRKAKFDADRAMYEAEQARLQVGANTGMAAAKTERERVALASDIADLKRKPLEHAHSEADLDIKQNPPEPETAED